MKNTAIEHKDVLIIGAGLSGICAAVHFAKKCPQKDFAILEARDAIGGTWDLFRYPGVRSDSDMYTFGYEFKPWTNNQVMASGDLIRDYINETADEFKVREKIRFQQKVVAADWNSKKAIWTLSINHKDGSSKKMTCKFVFCCSGYYNYEKGYTPNFEGFEDFKGKLIHPQKWPKDLDYSGKKIVVIGSGATAVTLVPALSKTAQHVTMLQRSPTYILAYPLVDKIANFFRKIFPLKMAYAIIRWKNVLLATTMYQLSRKAPNMIKKLVFNTTKRIIGEDFDFEKHFRPKYEPWDQRLCLVPNADFFIALKNKEASIVTDNIERFTENGILLKSGESLEADIIVTATGLEMQLIGGAKISLDGKPVKTENEIAYKGLMLSNVPNVAMVVGYTNASWTLKADLICNYICRLLNYMDEKGFDYCYPENADPNLEKDPLLNINAGYVLRAEDKFPKQGKKAPWRLDNNYFKDIFRLRYQGLLDETLKFRKLKNGEDFKIKKIED